MIPKRLVLLLPCLLVVGCSTVPEISVKERWNDSIKSFALVPIYPMLEQVYIGDLRLFVNDSSPYGLSSRYIGHVEGIEDELYLKEAALPVYPKTSAPPSLNDRSASMWQQPTGQMILPGADTQLRLRRAAFPSLTLVTVSEADLGGSGLSGLWNWIVGGSSRSEANLSLSVVGVETLELDDVTAYNATLEYFGKLVSTSDEAKVEVFEEGVCAAAQWLGDSTGEASKIAVVTRAFYARGIQYTYGDSFAASLRAAAGEGERPSLPNKNSETMEQLKGAQGKTLPSGTTEGNDGSDGNTVAVDLAELETRTTPGLIGEFAMLRSDRLALAETFERPMAFGVGVLAFPLSDIGIDCNSVPSKVGVRTDGITLQAPSERK